VEFKEVRMKERRGIRKGFYDREKEESKI